MGVLANELLRLYVHELVIVWVAFGNGCGQQQINFAAKNLTNPVRETQYEAFNGATGINSTYTAGIDLVFGVSYQVIF